jgi:hypothetical protein
VAQRANPARQIREGEGGIERRVNSGLFALIEPVGRRALRIGIRDDDRAVAGLLGSGGQVDGDSGFSRAALLIGDDARFQERDIGGILAFMKGVLFEFLFS